MRNLLAILVVGVLAVAMCQAASSTFNSAILKYHNNYRTTHSVGNLALNDSLNSVAQGWAESLIKSGKFEHNSNRGDNVGENIWTATSCSSSSYPTFSEDYIASNTVDSWYNEIKYWSFDTCAAVNKNVTGHFTQVVWSGSKTVGCGYQITQYVDGTWKCTKADSVCDYYPAGNYVGQYCPNVKKGNYKSA